MELTDTGIGRKVRLPVEDPHADRPESDPLSEGAGGGLRRMQGEGEAAVRGPLDDQDGGQPPLGEPAHGRLPVGLPNEGERLLPGGRVDPLGWRVEVAVEEGQADIGHVVVGRDEADPDHRAPVEVAQRDRGECQADGDGSQDQRRGQERPGRHAVEVLPSGDEQRVAAQARAAPSTGRPSARSRGHRGSGCRGRRRQVLGVARPDPDPLDEDLLERRIGDLEAGHRVAPFDGRSQDRLRVDSRGPRSARRSRHRGGSPGRRGWRPARPGARARRLARHRRGRSGRPADPRSASRRGPRRRRRPARGRR